MARMLCISAFIFLRTRFKSISTHAMKNFVWIFRSLLPYCLLKETHQAAQESLSLIFWVFFLQDTDDYPDFQKHEITLGNSLHFSDISHMHVFYNKHLICSQFIFYKIYKIRKPGFSCRLGYFSGKSPTLALLLTILKQLPEREFQRLKNHSPRPLKYPDFFQIFALCFEAKAVQNTSGEKMLCHGFSSVK